MIGTTKQGTGEVKLSELTDLVTKAGDASPEVWREALDGSGVRNRLWDGQWAVLSLCAALRQLEKHLHRKKENISVGVYQRAYKYNFYNF